jgi:hypothetical protein
MCQLDHGDPPSSTSRCALLTLECRTEVVGLYEVVYCDLDTANSVVESGRMVMKVREGGKIALGSLLQKSPGIYVY